LSDASVASQPRPPENAPAAPLVEAPLPPPTNGHSAPGRRELPGLCLLALGIVYGDIGTSPLYALRECFFGSHPVDPTRGNVLGVLSLVFWSLVFIISIKYLYFVLRADNRGEGGILALMALLTSGSKMVGRTRVAVIMLGIFGGALLFGDGIITPAISVLSAVEGLEVATPVFHSYVVPITVIVLVGLFLIQQHGTAAVGAMFGPVMLLWFGALAALGGASIVRYPDVLAAISPHHAAQFFLANGWHGYLVLGSVFLVVTGGEALYADMGHFGRRPIRLDWYAFVLPALLINYFGQGAMLLHSPEAAIAAKNTFFTLVPSWALYPMVALATAATVIASQAVISGVFSLTRQAIQLGYMPRMSIEHTSARHIGQIYVPQVNTLMMLGTIALVVGFGESSDLAAAYGIAVTMTMVITTLLFALLVRTRWEWSWPAIIALCLPLLLIELAFFGANAIKVLQGGWVPLVVGGLIFLLATTWKRGKAIVFERLYGRLLPIEVFIRDVKAHPPLRAKGTAIFMTGSPHGVPLALMHNLKHNQVLHERVIMLTVQTDETPLVGDEDRVHIEKLSDEFWSVVARYGFMEEPSVPEVLAACGRKGLAIEIQKTTFFLGHETLIAAAKPAMPMWRERLFAYMSRNALPATAFFHLPPNRVIEVGTQIEM
jgi:KUP system potassium uptake protein